MCIHIPSISGQNMFTLVKRDELSTLKLFCKNTGGKLVTRNDFSCTKTSTKSKPTQPTCGGFDHKKNIRGTLGCSNGGSNPVTSKQGSLSDKEGSKIVVKNPPEIKCQTRGRSPGDVKPQCQAIKKGQTGQFSGKISCPKNTDHVFRSGKSVAENPCKSKSHGQGAPIFCTPKEWA
ncbi:uncharacterized protein MELLADRAFT_113424 [Melampsora larici-populina 98AG31]|uniref:Uncharacterized protein n=1 Tax=Melampsora larici-populina (strain 98AG31 / pathotype 3-4-7) TaxID=747676 RepID=F4S9U3_MELLP|nr:uncharacterized protein MELLADRAFT_113424 [Melampsora larici-populina 98AG31]EGF98600.1 hypothetical protein MELLADRAFT_113424 [Melampsora larici-populina 98AG31]